MGSLNLTLEFEPVQKNKKQRSPTSRPPRVNANVRASATSPMPQANTEAVSDLGLERDKLAVAVLMEDFKARWQELMNFEMEVNRWSTLYVTAIVFSCSWILGQKDYQTFAEVFEGHQYSNAYIVLTLAVVNAIYTLAIAMRGYQIQQIALYLYEEVRPAIVGHVDATGFDRAGYVTPLGLSKFNSWEQWRREDFHATKREKGKPEHFRRVYYPIIGGLPAFVSLGIFGLYLKFRFNTSSALSWPPHYSDWKYFFSDLYFVVAVGLVVLIAVMSFRTTSINSRWERTLKSKREREEEPPPS